MSLTEIVSKASSSFSPWMKKSISSLDASKCSYTSMFLNANSSNFSWLSIWSENIIQSLRSKQHNIIFPVDKRTYLIQHLLHGIVTIFNCTSKSKSFSIQNKMVWDSNESLKGFPVVLVFKLQFCSVEKIYWKTCW